MTARSKTAIKDFFMTGDRPSQSNFGDLIDSYQDANTNLTILASANVGAVGLQLLGAVTSASALSHLGGTAVGIPVFQATTTAVAQQSIGGGLVGRQVFECVTTASATNIIGSTVASASTSTYGIVRIATSAEYLAGTAADRVPTVGVLGGDQLLSNNGFKRWPGGLVDQWGFDLGATDDGVVTFPVAFSVSAYTVVVAQTSPNNDVEIAIVSLSAAAFNYSHVGANTGSFYWNAKGR